MNNKNQKNQTEKPWHTSASKGQLVMIKKNPGVRRRRNYAEKIMNDPLIMSA